MAVVRTPRLRRAASIVLVGGLACAACGGNDGDSTGSTTPFTLLPPTTAVDTTTSTSTTTTTTTSSTSTTTTTTEPSTTTTVDPIVDELVLSGDGIGTAGFGADPDGTVDYLVAFLGAPDNDSGWVDPLSVGVCQGTVLRRVTWGVLTLLFGDVSTIVQGRRHFFGYTYGDQGQIGAPPVGLTTTRGVHIGSPVFDLRAAYPAVAIHPEDDFTPPFFYVNDVLRGFLTGIDDDAVVTAIIGGDDCGI